MRIKYIYHTTSDHSMPWMNNSIEILTYISLTVGQLTPYFADEKQCFVEIQYFNPNFDWNLLWIITDTTFLVSADTEYWSNTADMYLFYSPLHWQSQSQQTLPLHPWQAYPEFFSTSTSASKTWLTTPQGLNNSYECHHWGCLNPKYQQITKGWGEAVVKGKSAQLFHAVVAT